MTAGARLVPSDSTALIITVRLPAGLEVLRQRGIHNAGDGVPAHVTLLYPFAEPASLAQGTLATVGRVVVAHPAIDVRLVEGRRWPEVLYVAVEPEVPLRALQADLAATFPTLPLYGGAFPFTPHVSIEEGPGASRPDALDDPAWRSLPVTEHVSFVDLVVREAGRWSPWHRFALGGRARVAGAQPPDRRA